MRSAALRFSAFVLVVAASTTPAATYYVATNGNDADPGTLAQPWKTLQHAADRVAPGDTVEVRAGDFAGASFATSGTATRQIVVEAYAGESPSITADNPKTPDGINLEGASYMTLKGFTINGRTRAGIRAVKCQHVTIRDNRMDRNGKWGILTGFCDDLLIDHNVASRSIRQHGIYVSNSGDRPSSVNGFFCIRAFSSRRKVTRMESLDYFAAPMHQRCACVRMKSSPLETAMEALVMPSLSELTESNSNFGSTRKTRVSEAFVVR